MKTISKSITTLSIFILSSNSVFSQKTYLKIVKGPSLNDVIMYPPGTAFELKNKHGYIVFKNSDTPGILDIKEEHTLYVFPDWKDEVDVFKLAEGRLEKILTKNYGKLSQPNYHLNQYENQVKAKFTVSDSRNIEGEKNLDFKLNNGIAFEYFDGKFRAYLTSEDNYLHIEGKYIIESELGILKISFNPKNGRTWWVFENH